MNNSLWLSQNSELQGFFLLRILFHTKAHLTGPNTDARQFNLNSSFHQAVPLYTHRSTPLAHLPSETIILKGNYVVLLLFLLKSQSQDPNTPQFREAHQILLCVTTIHDSLLLLSIYQRQGMLSQIHPSTPTVLLQQDKSDSLSRLPKATRIWLHFLLVRSSLSFYPTCLGSNFWWRSL